jgi:hypothetical protein
MLMRRNLINKNGRKLTEDKGRTNFQRWKDLLRIKEGPISRVGPRSPLKCVYYMYIAYILLNIIK